MKKVAIMQPYFFPYLPYFQIISMADEFIFLDNVQHIRRGWVHRNRILLNGGPHTFSLPVQRGKQSNLINEKRLADDAPRSIDRLATTLQHAYGRTPFGGTASSMLTAATRAMRPDGSMLTVLVNSIEAACTAMNMPFKAKFASAFDLPAGLSGQDRIIALCKSLHANAYINPIGGANLYDCEKFKFNGTRLLFLVPDQDINYSQIGVESFVPNLSILDVISHLGGEGAAKLLPKCSIKRRAELIKI